MNKSKTIILVIIISILIFISLGSTSNCNLIRLINQIRAENNLPTLEHIAFLDTYAQYRLEHMKSLSHADYETCYIEFLKSNLKPGYYEYSVGEIIAYDIKSHSPEEYVNAWLNSPIHKEVILKDYFTRVGYCIGHKDGQIIIIVIFDYLKKVR